MSCAHYPSSFLAVGTVTKYQAVAIGSAQEGAETMLQEQYSQSMSFEGKHLPRASELEGIETCARYTRFTGSWQNLV